MLKKKLLIVMLVVFALATFAPQAMALSTACENFANRAVLGTSSAIGYALACAASDFGEFLDIIT